MTILSQGDKRWADVRLGASNLTLGRFGCTTTALAMASQRTKNPMMPDEIAHNAANYTPDGLILWWKLNIPGLRFLHRDVGFFPDRINEALKQKNRALLFEVKNGSHWVLATGRVAFSNDYIALDPWFGDEFHVLARYKNITKTSYFAVDVNVALPEFIPEDLKHLMGKILIAPEQRGRLYFVDQKGKLHDLGGSSNETVEKLGKLATGVSNTDLARIPK